MPSECPSFGTPGRTGPVSACSPLPHRRVNPGFQRQLKLYEAMGCAVDSSSALYKQHRLQVLTERFSGEWGSLGAGGCLAQKPRGVTEP